MTAKREDSETRYFIDLDLRMCKILEWGFDQRSKLAKQEPVGLSQLRIYVTRGQYKTCSGCDRLWREQFLGVPREYLWKFLLKRMP